MQKIIKKIKNNVWKIIGIIVLGILFFSYNILITLDASEYLGLANFIGTSKMYSDWVGHRGILFPLLLRIFQPFGIENKIFFLILMFIFYLIMIFTIIKIYKKCKELEIINNKIFSVLFIVWIIFFVVINPIIFSYFHTIMTEFVAIPLILLSCYLSWKWIDTSHKKLSVVFLTLITILLYHLKQSYVVAPLLAMLIASLISIIKKFNLSNFLYRIGSIAICIACLRIKFAYVELFYEE